MGEQNMTLLKKGAEASLSVCVWHGKKVVVKTRLPKAYRPAALDNTIRRFRTAREPQLMHEAKRAAVATPNVYMVDTKNAAITMEYIEGKQAKQLLDTLPDKERQDLCFRIGEAIGKLHRSGLVHGDLTTSNMLIDPSGRLVLVDFGLGDKTSETEAQGVDLHLLKHALQSTHYQNAPACYKTILQGYTQLRGTAAAGKVLEKIREIEKRGRYISERKQDDL
ncbi:MAG: Kae1-associated kinase Bud32 [Candidatus Bathyarchaeota archaeon]|nr:Kae1-associated kinase Bud32 [Candidatus Bathyarchaeota archaeon]